jgi:hypothetical protein
VNFEQKVEHYLEYSGWQHKFDGLALGWTKGGRSYAPQEAFIEQLKTDYEKDGNIERAAEILEKG